MRDLKQSQVFAHVRDEWNDARIESALKGLHLKQWRRTRRRTAALATGLSMALLVIIGTAFARHFDVTVSQMPHDRATVPGPLPNVSSAIRPISFSDGSSATPYDADSHMIVEQITRERIAVSIVAGGGHFKVTPNRERLFNVMVGEVSITVLGTQFTVERRNQQTWVAVSQGIVQVNWLAGHIQLAAGEEGLFPPASGVISPSLPDDSVLEGYPEEKLGRPQLSEGLHQQDWRSLAQAGNYNAASSQLATRGKVRDTVDDLLLASDTMRLSGQLAKALPYLEQIVSNHPGDPRAALAEFTRGRVLLSQLGSPREAASAFKRVQTLAPTSSLAQDALAREVESWYRVGEHNLARQRATEYLAQYPQGRRADSVRHFGGL